MAVLSAQQLSTNCSNLFDQWLGPSGELRNDLWALRPERGFWRSAGRGRGGGGAILRSATVRSQRECKDERFDLKPRLGHRRFRDFPRLRRPIKMAHESKTNAIRTTAERNSK